MFPEVQMLFVNFICRIIFHVTTLILTSLQVCFFVTSFCFISTGNVDRFSTVLYFDAVFEYFIFNNIRAVHSELDFIFIFSPFL